MLVGIEQSAPRKIDAHALDKVCGADVQTGTEQTAQ
jgi:hypothetical protein